MSSRFPAAAYIGASAGVKVNIGGTEGRRNVPPRLPRCEDDGKRERISIIVRATVCLFPFNFAPVNVFRGG